MNQALRFGIAAAVGTFASGFAVQAIGSGGTIGETLDEQPVFAVVLGLLVTGLVGSMVFRVLR